MPRQARIDAPGALHHIICRGIERRLIFKDDSDRSDFVARLSKLLPETATRCYAWALIPNHFHLLLKTGEVPIATLMRRLLTGYAISYNRRHRRHGHLFQNRYKSILCQEDTYLLELVRYIHLNPIRARQVSSLDQLADYPWCGHGRLLGKIEAGWQATDELLLWFGKRRATARQKYAEFVAEGIARGKRPELVGGGLIRSSGGWSQVKEQPKSTLPHKSDERILGDGDFVASVLAEADEQLEQRTRYQKQGVTFDSLLQLITEHFAVTRDDLLSASKRPAHVRARSLLCYWAVRELGMTVTEVARKVGMTQPAVSRAVERGRGIADEVDIDLPGRGIT
ncbi:transposase [Geothermobacter hydrogeniphilus]|uniref:Transposase n=1 Tax=Geothermobacter hydrogeniphilus TaxID=1969733 RepID=A0A1X0XHN8_9BACT|nr:transposase [Geothermobacter hydrogeniphilus]ORJ52414.1 transposase [Geothermobacter hydrogeniphilus]